MAIEHVYYLTEVSLNINYFSLKYQNDNFNTKYLLKINTTTVLIAKSRSKTLIVKLTKIYFSSIVLEAISSNPFLELTSMIKVNKSYFGNYDGSSN
jgi:hypothetical protein